MCHGATPPLPGYRHPDWMKIAILAPPWIPVPPRGYGGIEQVVELLSAELVERGHDVTMYAAPGSRSAAEVESPLDEPHPDEIQEAIYDCDLSPAPSTPSTPPPSSSTSSTTTAGSPAGPSPTAWTRRWCTRCTALSPPRRSLSSSAGPGQPPEREFFAREVEPHLDQDGVRYIGEVGEEKLDLYARAAAPLMPIRWAEPFGLVMTEGDGLRHPGHRLYRGLRPRARRRR